MPATPVSRSQVLAFRAVAHSLDRRRPAGELAAVAGACGIQDTPAGNADVSLHARVDLDGPVVAAAVADRRLVLTWSMRGAPHAVPPADLAVFTLGAAPADGRSLAAVAGGASRPLADAGIDPADALVRIEAAMVDALGTDEVGKGDLSGRVRDAVDPVLAPWCRGCAVHHPPESLFRAATLMGRIVLAGTSPVTLVRTATWLGEEPSGDVGALRLELMQRYLRCYGPSRPADFAAWAGIGPDDARQRWPGLSAHLVPVTVEGRKAEVLDDDLDRLGEAAPRPGVRLLPAKDVLMQARDRGLLIPDAARRKTVFPTIGGPGVVLVDGEPAGTWRGAAKGRRYEVTVEPFGKPSRAAVAALEGEAGRVARARGYETSRVQLQP